MFIYRGEEFSRSIIITGAANEAVRGKQYNAKLYTFSLFVTEIRDEINTDS